MARTVTTIGGRLGSSNELGLNFGPSGIAWSPASTVIPSSLNKLVSDPDYGAGNAVISFVGTLSVWCFISAVFNDLNMFVFLPDSVGINSWVEIGLQSGRPTCRLRRVSTTNLVNVTSPTTLTTGAWNHILLSWDLNTGTAYATDFHMYLNDVDAKPVTPATYTIGTEVDWGGGGQASDYRLSFGNTTQATNVRFSSIWLDFTRYLDFSVESNRRKFIDSSLRQLKLGVDGSLPTGNQPPIYLNDPVATLANNRGSIGTFTVGTPGPLIDVAGPPAAP